MKAFAERSSINRRKLLPSYEEYVSQVSVASMAISLELASFLLTLCELMKPAFIADFGSGFSSFVFRLYAAQSDSPVDVWSVDDEPAWLDRTRAFLAERNLPTTQLEVWDHFASSLQPRFDLILNDIGTLAVREHLLPTVLGCVRPGGVIVLDDVHKPQYRIRVRHAVRVRGYEYYSLLHYTQDRYGRFANLAIAARQPI